MSSDTKEKSSEVEYKGRSTEVSSGAEVPERQQWSNRAEFLMSCISLSVGLGNIWRFPFAAFENGGGAFLIPYVIVLFLIGKPMYFMEIAFGQYFAEGPVKIWKKSVPLARGIGLAQVLVNFYLASFLMIVMVWTTYYFFATFAALVNGQDVPWGNDFCKSEWAYKETCAIFDRTKNDSTIDLDINQVIEVVQFTNGTTTQLRMQSSAEQYFQRAVTVRFEQGTMENFTLTNMGDINLHLLGCLAGCWVVVYLSVIKGVKSAGKVVYITATMPFIVLIILLGQGAALENAGQGILYFFTPQFEKLITIGPWRAAAEQMFNSLNVGFGSLVMLGSYNTFKNNCYQDALIVSVLDSVTSLVAGIAMFSILGFLSFRLDVGIESVVQSGPGMTFVTFPAAVEQMPAPHLFGLLFFLMLFMLGLGSLIGTVECVLTFFVDRFPKLRTKRPYVAGVLVGIIFLVDLAFITQGGPDLFDIFVTYAAGTSILFVATFEFLAIMWTYGMKRFANNIKEMLGKNGEMGWYFRTAWVILSPVTIVFILMMSIISYTPMSRPGGLPPVADTIGWLLAASAFIQVPIWAIYVVYKAKGTTLLEKLNQSLWPDEVMDQPEKNSNGFQMDLVATINSRRDEEGRTGGEKLGIVNPGYSLKDDAM